MESYDPRSSEDIYIAAAIIKDSSGRNLLVRKRNTHIFMQAGGKIENNEGPVEALHRELKEELGITAKEETIRYIGHFSAPAANEIDQTVSAEIFSVSIANVHDIKPAAEIEQIVWYSKVETPEILIAPLSLKLMDAVT